MNDPRQPLPLSDVLDIIERRRRQRARRHTVAGSIAGVAAAGLAGLIVVTIQTGSAPLTPAASPLPPATSAPPPATTSSSAPPFDPAYLRSDYLTGLADSILTGGTNPDHVEQVEDAYELAQAWDVPLYPAAKAIAAKATQTGTEIDPGDPDGDDDLITLYEQAGYTDAYAEVLADAWSTDTRTAKIVGALVIEAG